MLRTEPVWSDRRFCDWQGKTKFIRSSSILFASIFLKFRTIQGRVCSFLEPNQHSEWNILSFPSRNCLQFWRLGHGNVACWWIRILWVLPQLSLISSSKVTRVLAGWKMQHIRIFLAICWQRIRCDHHRTYIHSLNFRVSDRKLGCILHHLLHSCTTGRVSMHIIFMFRS